MKQLQCQFSMLLFSLTFYFPFQGFSVMVICLLLVIIITIPDPSFQRQIPRQTRGVSNCLKSKRLDASGVVAICNILSFRCLPNTVVYGYPKCQPVYEMRTYNLIKGNRSVTLSQRVTVDCVCASCAKCRK